MDDPWEKAYVYGRTEGGKVSHIISGELEFVCDPWHLPFHVNHTPKPYPVCKNCLKTKRAKELGL